MITYIETKDNLINYINSEIEEIRNIKELYQNKLKVFEKYLTILNDRIQKEEKVEEINDFMEILHLTEENIKFFNKQIENATSKIAVLSKLEKDIDEYKENSFKQRINEYNEDYNNFKKEFVENLIIEEQLELQYIKKKVFNEIILGNTSDFKEKEDFNLEEINNDEDIIKDNNTLLISEIKDKVILPYKVSELKEILTNSENHYSDMQTIIDEKYTVPLIRYRYASISRFRETFILMKERENASLLDCLDLALELMRNRYVHPAIITACKNSDQLDVYLDCLETNELDDFPFFEIKYELYPIKVKTKKYDFEINNNVKYNFGDN